MKDINTVVMTGRLVSDPEVKYFEKFVAVNFTLAVNIYQDEVSYFDIRITNNEYKKLFDYLKKGVKIGIEGKLKQERWKTQEGQTRSRIVVKVSIFGIALMDSNKDSNGNNDNYSNSNRNNGSRNGDDNNSSNNQNNNNIDDEEEDDLPF